MLELQKILRQWHELWRYPDLLVALEQADAEEAVAASFAKGLIDGLASPQSPRECLLSLLRRGEFQAAKRVLEMASFEAVVDADDHEALFQELDKSRRRAADKIHARAAVLGARASRVELPSEAPPSMGDVIDKRVTEALIFLDVWENKIQKRETAVAGELRRDLKKAMETTDKEITPGMAAWQESVERCLKAQEYEAARFLVESGPGVTVPDESFVVPRRPRWPWNESLEVVLQWFEDTQSAPPDFHARWRHNATDMPAVRLLNVLKHVADSGVTDDDSARELADALDGFLGREGIDREVIARGNWFETRLHAPVDPRLPCFAASDSAGVYLWIPRIWDAAPLVDLEAETSGLCFLRDESIPCPKGVVGFDSWTLLKLFADREHRRFNFLREIGGKLDLEAVVPIDISGVLLPPIDPGAVRGYTAGVLDIVNVELKSPAVVDVIVYYVGANLRLALHLLRALLGSTSSRHVAIGLDDVERAWRMPAFRNAARLELLSPLDDEPLLRAVLGAGLYVGLRPGGPLSAEEICLAIQMLSEKNLEEAKVREILDHLTNLGLIEISDTNGYYRIPASGIGSILLDAIVDLEEYVKRAFEVADRT